MRTDSIKSTKLVNKTNGNEMKALTAKIKKWPTWLELLFYNKDQISFCLLDDFLGAHNNI
jgi:hypothetical protein